MICKNCNHKNITTALYCSNCSAPFSEEERKQAYDKTIYLVLDSVSNQLGSGYEIGQ